MAQTSRAQSSRERLNHLLELAARGPEGRGLLLDELGDLLTDWPADYAQAMRGPFETLFEKTAREAEPEARARLAERFAADPGFPVALLNELYLDAPQAARAQILKRNEALSGDGEPPKLVDSQALVAAARGTVNGAFAGIFAGALILREGLAREILRDAEAFAVACKGAGLDRAAYSAVALLTASDASAALKAYDTVSTAGAKGLMRFWQERG